MSNKKVHVFEVKPREGIPESTPQSAATTEVYLDGQLLKGVTRLNVSFDAKKSAVATITLDFIGQIRVFGSFEEQLDTSDSVGSITAGSSKGTTNA